ncbi:hypothetical protein AYL99_03585 [Fonsecaea erecta]|uniref:Uncharacterized protein n=1 Tax=Fonsecaea erecta TaxID=1367422 RepID=A0A178ZP05_9EURO|nr:hypothetical protein AYL99_03585 [Fonsecaea erecta]OAP61382.1 hypothetical protein AYL99_03585 [Fonsecaea erecta]
MDDEAQLKYELAEVAFDKRQLLLERRELSIKRRLEQLKPSVNLTQNTVNSIEDTAVVKTEDVPDATDKTGVTAQNRPSAEVQADLTAASLNMQSTPAVSPDRTVAIKEHQEKVDPEKQEAGTGAHRMQNVTHPRRQTSKADVLAGTAIGSNKGEEASSHYRMKRRRSLSSPPEMQAAVPEKSRGTAEDLLAEFSGRPPARSTNVPLQRKQAGHSDHLAVSSESGTDSETSDAAGRQGNRFKRRRTSQEDEKKHVEVSRPMTESQKYDIIELYTHLLLKHMTAVESSVPSQWLQKPTVVSKMRRTTNGTIHHTLSLLHQEFEMTIHAHAKSIYLRQTLVGKLNKFQDAQPHWWPECQALNTQQERISFVTKVFQAIADDKFKE